LDAVHGSEPDDVFVAVPPASSYRAETGAHPGKLRIGVLTKTTFGEIHPECLAATTGAAKLLESLGHTIEDSYPEALLDPGLGGPQTSALNRDLVLRFINSATYEIRRQHVGGLAEQRAFS